MKGYLTDHDPLLFRLIRGFTAGVGLIVLLLLSHCAFDRVRGKLAIRADLPPQLEPSLFVDADVCSELWGGYSYVVPISSEAASALRREGPTWLAEPASSIDRDKAAPWLPSEGMERNYDAPPRGLQCLNGWEINGQPLGKHLYRKGGYYRSYHSRQGDYIVPSLGIVVGGFDPR